MADVGVRVNTPHRLSFLLDGASDAEQAARLREWRVVCALICGWDSAPKIAIERALAGSPAAVAIEAIDKLPSRQRRRVLACVCALMRGGQ
jgi:hypothetical protein